MSLIKSFAHGAHQALAPLAPQRFRRSHVYELMAAGLGFKSWASLHPSHVLVDAADASLPPHFDRHVMARALQLGFAQTEARSITEAFGELSKRQPMGCMPLAALDAALLEPAVLGDVADTDDPESEEDFVGEDEWQDDETDESDEDDESEEDEPFASTPTLIADLEDRAARGDVLSHYRLARLLACQVPSDHLYQESLKGRVLTVQERRWVDDYLLLSDQHARYVRHLTSAADGGVRAAALELSIVTGNGAYRQRAEQMEGVVSARLMADSAPDATARRTWLWRLVDQGDARALHQLAREGDEQALSEIDALERQQAIHGDEELLRGFAEEALRDGNAVAAWAWQCVALHHGLDLTASSMQAHHDGGPNAGDFYDSDFGGPLYVSGTEGLTLPAIDAEQQRQAETMAQRFLASAQD